MDASCPAGAGKIVGAIGDKQHVLFATGTVVVVVKHAIPVVVPVHDSGDITAADENGFHRAVDEIIVEAEARVVEYVNRDLGRKGWSGEEKDFDTAVRGAVDTSSDRGQEQSKKNCEQTEDGGHDSNMIRKAGSDGDALVRAWLASGERQRLESVRCQAEKKANASGCYDVGSGAGLALAWLCAKEGATRGEEKR